MAQQEIDQQVLIEQIIALLDDSTLEGVGHLNISVEENEILNKRVEVLGCTDCAKGDLACSIPTLRQGMDRE